MKKWEMNLKIVQTVVFGLASFKVSTSVEEAVNTRLFQYSHGITILLQSLQSLEQAPFTTFLKFRSLRLEI